MTLNEFWEEIEKKPVESYIVTLKYKYDHETEYIVENQILEVDIQENPYPYVWLNDWNEGQTDIEVVSYIAVSDVDTTRHTGDLVSRQEVIKELHDMYRHCVTLEDWHINGADAIYRIEHMPSAKPEPCEDAVSRAEAQTALQFVARRYTVAHEAHGEGHVVWSDNLISVPDAMNALREVPSAEPQRKKGKWLMNGEIYGHMYWRCSQCGEEVDYIGANFCPNCGSFNGGAEDE